VACAIARDFGSIDRWRTEFAAMGEAGGRFRLGDPRLFSDGQRLVDQWAADHMTTLAGGRPVLVFDMYELAYHMDFDAKAASYVGAYMESAGTTGRSCASATAVRPDFRSSAGTSSH
jgi:Fe-Mn family superoxide dismutase